MIPRLIPDPDPRARPEARRYSAPQWYSHAIGYEAFGGDGKVDGLWASQTNEQPYVVYPESLRGARSTAQLWAIGYDGPSCWSTLETGWSESAGIYGDTEPHLFVFAFDCGEAIGYAGGALPWVQVSPVAYPNMVLSHNDRFHLYGTRLVGGDWWVYYGGEWLGYVPGEAWTSYFPSSIDEAQAGGEVATPNRRTCTDMGYAGLPRQRPGRGDLRRRLVRARRRDEDSGSESVRLGERATPPSTGNWKRRPGPRFRYGGPGWC